MDREKKNQNTRDKIKESAVREFAVHGYEAASLNEICQKGGVSKGIIYHYFESKEVLYLACIEECFDKLTEYIEGNMSGDSPDNKKRMHTSNERAETKSREIDIFNGEDMLTEYFNLRLSFFRQNPEYASLFCGAVLFPPEYLKGSIREKRKRLDDYNRNVFMGIVRNHINPCSREDDTEDKCKFVRKQDKNNMSVQKEFLRQDIDDEEILNVFDRIQDFLNAGYRDAAGDEALLEKHEKECRSALSIFLYGIIRRD